MGVTVFSNARSSEYMILFDLFSKMEGKLKLFYPCYFNKNRDDTQLSLMSNVDDLRVIACFARRSKTDHINSKKTVISFRNSIFEQIEILKELQIPVIAGTPLGTWIEKIGFGSECQWFEIHSGVAEHYIEYEFNDYIIDENCLVAGIDLLNDNLINKLFLSAPKRTWKEIIELIRKWYELFKNYYYRDHYENLFNSYSGLKPIFIIYKI